MAKLVKTILAGCMTLFLLDCNQVDHFLRARNQTSEKPPDESSIYRKPSATEVFNLRSKCADLGNKLLEDTASDVARDEFQSSQTTHYNPKTNRCYVEIEDSNMLAVAAGKTKEPILIQRLYDGQTGDQLAFVSSRNGEATTATINNENKDFAEASDYIDQKMKDERRY